MAHTAKVLPEKEYQNIHYWVTSNFGKADHCEDCLGINAKRFSWANISHNYLRDIRDWKQLCYPCHFTLDGVTKEICGNGHLMSADNIYYDVSRNKRNCRGCRAMADRSRKEREKQAKMESEQLLN